jgi:hypothetical protein
MAETVDPEQKYEHNQLHLQIMGVLCSDSRTVWWQDQKVQHHWYQNHHSILSQFSLTTCLPELKRKAIPLLGYLPKHEDV